METSLELMGLACFLVLNKVLPTYLPTYHDNYRIF